MIMRGLWRLAKCERAGITEFGPNAEHFAASLAPLIGIPMALAMVMALHGAWQQALLGFLVQLVTVILLPLAVYEFSRLFGREQYWLRTATVLNWSFWVILPAVFVAALFAAVLAKCGLGLDAAENLALGLMGLYLLWYRLFALAAGLGVKFWQAGVILLVSSIAMACISLSPNLFKLGGVWGFLFA
jgi:hypothetical protein